MKAIPPWAFGASVAAVVVAALLTVLVTGRGPAELPAGSPEAAVQDYLETLRAGEPDATLALLAPGTSCTTTDDVDATGWVDEDTHVALREVEVNASTARVEVTITTDSGGLLPSGWTEEQTFHLERVGDAWLLADAPWPLYDCGALR